MAEQSEQATGDVVVITGATAGVGRATARAFARRGARIGLLARGKEGLENTREEVQALGGEALVLPTDVADAQQVEDAASAVEGQFGPIDIWINNAMTSVFAPFSALTAEEYRRVTEVTYLGQVHGAMSALKRMRPRNRGSIVFVGSALAYRGIPLQSAYCGAKHGVQGLFDALRAELIHDNSKVRITMVQLPGLNTPQFRWVKNKLDWEAQPVPPIYQPEVAADAIVWAAYHNRRELTVGFRNALMLWANQLFPGVGDWYLARTAYRGQQTHERHDPDRAYNLWEAVEEDRGARGVFTHKAYETSLQLKVNEYAQPLTLVAAALVAAALFLLGREADAGPASGAE
jgi:short-subunit dehydrogenase